MGGVPGECKVEATITKIRAVRLALNGASSGEIAQKLHLKKQYVAALLAYDTMWQNDYADPETIIGSVDCPHPVPTSHVG